MYYYKDYIKGPTWCPEVMGFVLKIVLYRIKISFVTILNDNWVLKSLLLCMIAGIIGIGYLKFKTISFLGLPLENNTRYFDYYVYVSY